MTESDSTSDAGAGACKVEVQNVRREQWFARGRIAASLVAMVALPWILGALGASTLATLGGLGALGAYFWSAVSLAGTDRGPGERRMAPGTARIEGDQLAITSGRESTRLPLSGLDGGWVERVFETTHETMGDTVVPVGHPGDGYRAVLSFSDGRVVAVEKPSEQEAAALLAEAGAGAAARAVRMRGYREDPAGRKIAGFFAAFFGLLLLPVVVGLPVMLFAAATSSSASLLGAALSSLVGVVPLAAMFRWMWRKVRPTWIQIGADGVVLQGPFRKRFFRHDEILHARPTMRVAVALERSVEIRLTNGRTYWFPASSSAEAQAVCDRIQAARTATNEQERARLLDVLARAGRPVPEWRRALESLVGAAGYRSAGHDIEAVMRIVEDVAAPLEQRIAAALAARPQGGEEAKKRIRIAAEACVEPRVRVALEKASAGALEDDALEEIAAASEEASASREASSGAN